MAQSPSDAKNNRYDEKFKVCIALSQPPQSNGKDRPARSILPVKYIVQKAPQAAVGIETAGSCRPKDWSVASSQSGV
jgi:hypothetical protein